MTYISHSFLCSLISCSVLTDDFLMLISSVLKVRRQLSFNSKQTDSRGQEEVLETQNVSSAQLFHLALKEMICASQFVEFVFSL